MDSISLDPLPWAGMDKGWAQGISHVCMASCAYVQPDSAEGQSPAEDPNLMNGIHANYESSFTNIWAKSNEGDWAAPVIEEHEAHCWYVHGLTYVYRPPLGFLSHREEMLYGWQNGRRGMTMDVNRTPRKSVNGETFMNATHEDDTPMATSDVSLVMWGYVSTSLKEYVVNAHESLDEIVLWAPASVKCSVMWTMDTSYRDGPNTAQNNGEAVGQIAPYPYTYSTFCHTGDGNEDKSGRNYPEPIDEEPVWTCEQSVSGSQQVVHPP